MSRRTFPVAGVGLALSLLAAFAGLGACAAAGSNSDAENPAAAGATGEDSAGTGAVSPADGGAPDTTESGGKGGAPPIDVDPTGSAGSRDETCAADVTTAEVVPLDLYIMLDSSQSMLDPILANSTKWSAVKSGIRNFLRDKPSAGLGVGLQYFPLPKPDVPASCSKDDDCGDAAPCIPIKLCYDDSQAFGRLIQCTDDSQCFLGPCIQPGKCEKDMDYYCPELGKSCNSAPGDDLGVCVAIPVVGFCAETSVCDATAYATPAEPIVLLPDAADALISSLDAHVPGGNTPTGPALRGALQQATSYAKAHPNDRVIAVMTTDGLPTNCTPTNIDEIGDIAADARAALPSIRTAVIGVLSAADVNNGAQKQLDVIARAGGTNAATVVDTNKDVASQILAALDAIRTDPLSCEFKIPAPAPGKDLDYGHVNVSYERGKKSTPLYYVGSLADCDPDTGGWYYDSNPRDADPKAILACPASCTLLQADTLGSVEIALGCETIVK